MAIQHVPRQPDPPCHLPYWWQLSPAEVPLPTLFPRSLSLSSQSDWKLPSLSPQFVVYPGPISALNMVPVPCRALRPPTPLGMTHCSVGMESAFLTPLRRPPRPVPISSSSLAPAGT